MLDERAKLLLKALIERAGLPVRGAVIDAIDAIQNKK